MKDHIGKIFIVAAVVAIGGSIVYANQVANQANEGVEITSHVKGNPEAEVVLVEYSDFQCPACAQFYPYVKEVVEAYPDDLRFEYKHFPLISIHPFAVPAGRAAEAAGQQGEFFAMHDKLFENQQTWANSSNPISYFTTYAEELELDIDLFKRHYKASLIEDAVNNDFREARDRGLTGTPTFFLNGERMEIDSFADFRTQIEAALGVTVETENEAAASDSSTTSETTAVDVGDVNVETDSEADVRFGF